MPVIISDLLRFTHAGSALLRNVNNPLTAAVQRFTLSRLISANIRARP